MNRKKTRGVFPERVGGGKGVKCEEPMYSCVFLCFLGPFFATGFFCERNNGFLR